MERYIQVNTDRLKHSHSEIASDYSVELSPYDTPRAIVSNYVPNEGVFLIAFEYIDDEPATMFKSANHVCLFQGKHSGKLLKVTIPVAVPLHDDSDLARLRTNVLSAITDNQKVRKRGKMNRRVTKELLEQEFSDLASDLVY